MQIDFGDAVVESVRLDYMLNIQLAPGGRAHIEVPVTFESAGTVHVARVGEVDLTGDPVFDDLVGCRVTHAEAAHDGTLTLEFSNGQRLQAGIDVGTESWDVVAQGGCSTSADPSRRLRACRSRRQCSGWKNIMAGGTGSRLSDSLRVRATRASRRAGVRR